MKTETPQMDWQQVALNGGPPCFHIEGPQYCGRAERWQGHDNKAFHDYVSLDDLLNAERERCAKDVCGYCDGHFPQYDPIPAGPNSANNWIHLPKQNGDNKLCAATGIFSRIRYESAIRGKQ